MKPSDGTRARHERRSRQCPPMGVRKTPPVRMRRTGGTFSMSGVTPCSPHSCAKHRRNASTAGSSTPPDARSSSGVCGMKRWIVRTGEPIVAANRALRVMPSRASASSRSTRTKAPLGQDTGASAVSATSSPDASTARRTTSAARCVDASSRDVAGHEAQLEAGPRAAGEPLGDLISLGSGLEQRDGGGASRHMS